MSKEREQHILKYSQVTILGAGKLKDLYTQMRRVIRWSMMMIMETKTTKKKTSLYGFIKLISLWTCLEVIIEFLP